MAKLEGGGPMDEAVLEEILELDGRIRYVAFGERQRVGIRERAGLSNASATASDRFEELLVNPALVTLARQRGEIDCGGLRHIVVAYGNFVQLVIPTVAGHVSIALENGTDAERIAELVAGVLARRAGARPSPEGAA